MLFRSRNRAGAYAASLLSGASLFATFLFISYYLQAVKGFDPLEAGLLGLPFSVGVVVSTWIAQRALPRLGPRTVTTIGFALAAIGTGGLTRIAVSSVYLTDLLPWLLVMSLGMGLVFVPLTIVAVDGLHPGDLGVGSALVNMCQQIGGSLGVALLNTVATAATAASRRATSINSAACSRVIRRECRVRAQAMRKPAPVAISRATKIVEPPVG